MGFGRLPSGRCWGVFVFKGSQVGGRISGTFGVPSILYRNQQLVAAGQELIGAGNQLRAEMTAAITAAPKVHPHPSPMVGYGDVLASPV